MPAVLGIIGILVLWRFLVLTAGEVFMRAGLPPEAARFEARSALTGSGYTTSESEIVVKDPASRRVVSILFLVGFIGPATLLGLLGFGFLLPSSNHRAFRLAVLLGLLAGLGVLERTGFLTRVGRRPARLVADRISRARVADTWMVFGEYAILSLQVVPEGPLVERSIGDLFGGGDITVLSIWRNQQGTSNHMARPPPDEHTKAGDHLILFGRSTDLVDLNGDAV